MMLYILCTLYVVNHFSAVDEAAASNDIVCPPMEYTAYVFYINTERNTWKMHFNVTKALDALIKVSLYAPILLYWLQANFICSKSRRSMMLMKWQLTFSFDFVAIEFL